VWRRERLLEILNHFVVDRDRFDEKGKKTGEREVIFPRYHQLDAVRRLWHTPARTVPDRTTW